MAKILSSAEIDSCRHDLYEVRNKTQEYCDAVTKIISLYENDAIVQTLFASGSFGQRQLEDLKLLDQNVKSYFNELSNQLVPKTAQYLSEQERLVNGGED